ncbi:MAG: TraR/DksA C4-type zinc finger protein [Gammaproteobacteria bacterium]|nr:TraR/DksA C4-type zinc finger protein [Gammaproteobacteria bacterium]MCP5136176.1 TraR/DksA C4-type zinc finger protein [Gammaproteobacteria bacterium]
MDICDMADKTIEDQIQNAIRRITLNRAGDGRTHSHCAECGNPIPVERRRALPQAKTCVDCAESLEFNARVVGVAGRDTGAWWW